MTRRQLLRSDPPNVDRSGLIVLFSHICCTHLLPVYTQIINSSDRDCVFLLYLYNICHLVTGYKLNDFSLKK